MLDYKATVAAHRRPGLPTAIAGALGAATAVVVPPGCRRSGSRRPWPTTARSAIDLDGFEAVVTAAAVAAADTGTIVLDGSPDQGRRAISLIPDILVCVLRADQVVQTCRRCWPGSNPTRPLTLISGPSATSDIELQRVEGVHGPRNLHVVLVL